MKLFSNKALIALGAMAMAVPAFAGVTPSNISKARSGRFLNVSFDIVLDSVKVGADRQFYITPVIERNDTTRALSTVLINGRNMQFCYERGTIKPSESYDDICDVVRRYNGRPQRLHYDMQTTLAPWMFAPDAGIAMVIDSCGCGINLGQETLRIPLDLTPDMRLARIRPAVTQAPETVHEGRARVQFEVDRTELHAEPYKCRNGQRIDNREQLAMIDDSVSYALSDPNVTISSIEITGLASPESPYLHNDYLATNRSKALAEYLADRYKLPAGVAKYDAVPENWEEFREIVVNASDITEPQREALLEIIDRPAYGPADYDAKERALKTDSRVASLYRTKVLPEWFPRLRATRFAIKTRLRPMPDQQLAEVILTHPEMLSLNQMYRVALLYPEGSPEFERTMATALKYYGDSPEANLNSAVSAIAAGDYTRAAELLKKAGNSPEAENARGVLAVKLGDFDAARTHFGNAAPLPEAKRNLDELP